MKTKFIQCLIAGAAITGSPLMADGLPFKSGEKIAFLGDSITELGSKNPLGYVRLVMDGIKRSGIDAEAVPAGISGNMSHQMRARLERDVISKKPQWMFLSCGVNDAPNGIDNPGLPLEQYTANINAVIDRCNKAGIRVIILTATPVVEEPEHVANKNLVRYNESLRNVAAGRKLPIVDLNKRFNAFIAQKPDKQKRVLTVDGTHMAPYGDILMAYTILQQLGMDTDTLHKAAAAWMEQQDGWQTKMTLKLSVAEMEKIRKNLPEDMTLEEWIHTVVRQNIAE